MKNKKINKFLTKNISQFREVFQSKKFGKFSLGSFIYLILRVFIQQEKYKYLEKVKRLSYKALQRSPWIGTKLILAYGLVVFTMDFKLWLSKGASHKSENRLAVRIDRSTSGSHYGKKIPYLKELYDYVKKYNKKTHQIEVLLVSLGRKDYILGFKIIEYKRKYKKKKGRQRRTNGYITALRLLKGVLTGLDKDLRKEFLRYSRLSLDGWYGKELMLIELSKLGLYRNAIKSGGVGKIKHHGKLYDIQVFKEFLKRRKDFRVFHPKHGLHHCQYVEEPIVFAKSGLEARAILIKYTGKRKVKDRYLLLFTLCPKEEWHAYQVVQCYKSRWQVEVMFRTTKQIHDLEKYSYHSDSIKNIELHFALCFISYMWLNWYRVEHTRMSRTSLKDVKESFIIHFSTYNSKSLMKLFSG